MCRYGEGEGVVDKGIKFQIHIISIYNNNTKTNKYIVKFIYVLEKGGREVFGSLW